MSTGCVAQPYDDLASGSTRRAVLLVVGEYTSRAPGFVPVANVQLLIGTSAVLSSFVMASSVVVHLAQREDEHRLPCETPAAAHILATALQGDYAMAASSSRYFRIRR